MEFEMEFSHNITIQLNATDVDTPADSLCYRLVSQPLGTVLSFNNRTGVLVYEANVPLLTRDIFRFVLNDQGQCGTLSQTNHSIMTRRLLKRSSPTNEGDSNTALVVFHISSTSNLHSVLALVTAFFDLWLDMLIN